MLHADQQFDQTGERRYHVYVPDNPVAPTLPAIIVFHGGGQDVAQIAMRWGVDLDPATAPNFPVPPELENYMLVFPEADPRMGSEWKHYGAHDSKFVTHDLDFVKQLLFALVNGSFLTNLGPVSADPQLLYAAGFSNGGGMVWQIAWSFDSLIARFRGFGAVGKGLDPEKVRSYRQRTGVPAPAPTAFMYIHGTADGTFRPPTLQIEAEIGMTMPAFSVQNMLDRNGVTAGTPANTWLAPNSKNVTEVVAQAWTGNAAFSAVTVINGGHNWPSPRTAANPPVATHVNATTLLLEFWRTHAGLP